MTRLPRPLLLLCGLLLSLPLAAQGHALPAHHAKAGLHCFDCHQEEKPTKKAVASESCMTCHGDYPAMKAFTKDAKPNPTTHTSVRSPAPSVTISTASPW